MKVALIGKTEKGPEAIILVPRRLDLLWPTATVDELADTREECRRIQDDWTDFRPASAEDKTVIVKSSPRYELKVFHPYTTTSDVLTTDQTNEILTIVSCLTRTAWKASRRGDSRRQVNRLDNPDPRRVSWTSDESLDGESPSCSTARGRVFESRDEHRRRNGGRAWV